MDINVSRAIDQNYLNGSSQSDNFSGTTGQNNPNMPGAIEKTTNSFDMGAAKDNVDRIRVPGNDSKTTQNLNKENLDSITIALNKFMESLNANIHFKLHDATKELIVQVVDESTQKVLKEFPPHKLLDTIAAIQDRIGVLLDKKV
jgi:flagellar protein FlaG